MNNYKYSLLLLLEDNQRSPYLKYKVSDREQKLYNGITDDEKLYRRVVEEKTKRPDPKKRFCPLCHYEAGDIVEMIYVDGLLECSKCGYHPPDSTPAPLVGEGMIRSGNQYVDNRKMAVARFSLSSLANSKKSRKHARKRSQGMIDALHSVNNIDPYEPDLM